MQIDASDWDEWVYINLSIGAIVNIEDPEDNSGWDIACNRYHFRTNSGLSGNGYGGAYVDSMNTWTSSVYNNLIVVPSNSFFETDTLVNTFYDIDEHEEGLEGVANPALETWAIIDIDNDYTMYFSNNQYIVRCGLGLNYYKLWAVDYYNQNGTSGYITIIYDEIDSSTLSINSFLPNRVEIFNNYPNPFNPSTVFPFSLNISGHVEIEIVNLNGKVLSKIFSKYLDKGMHEIFWNSSENGNYLSSGIYQYRIFLNNEMIGNKKITLIK